MSSELAPPPDARAPPPPFLASRRTGIRRGLLDIVGPGGSHYHQAGDRRSLVTLTRYKAANIENE